MPNFPEDLTRSAQVVTETLDVLLPKSQGGGEAKLYEAMRYACMNGGKRLRPFLSISAANIFGASMSSSLRVAAAVEMIHCYSLIHDDLPSIDDSDLRRGQPSLHKQYNEATAILAGDALQSLAFEILAQPETHETQSVRVELVRMLAEAIGPRGMVGGQMMDLIAEEETLDVGAITRLQRMKTGKLIIFCCESGAVVGRGSERARHALASYGQAIGLAFQITDDLLDVEGDEKKMGKPKGQDKKKSTFVSILGTEKAREQAQMLANQAKRHLEIFDRKADPLRDIADFILARKS